MCGHSFRAVLDIFIIIMILIIDSQVVIMIIIVITGICIQLHFTFFPVIKIAIIIFILSRYLPKLYF
jgi:hypothetical protein